MAHYIRDVDIAARLGVHRTTVWRWARSGILPAPCRLGPATVRWRAEDIERFERTRGG